MAKVFQSVFNRHIFPELLQVRPVPKSVGIVVTVLVTGRIKIIIKTIKNC